MKRVFALVLLLLPALAQPVARELKATVCLLYTSDAADE